MMTSRSVFGLFWSLLLSFPEMCLGTVGWVMTWRGIQETPCLDVEAGGEIFVRAASPDKGRPSEGTGHVGLHSLSRSNNQTRGFRGGAAGDCAQRPSPSLACPFPLACLTLPLPSLISA